MSESSANTYEDKTEGQQSDASFVKMWLAEIDRADKEEKEWRDRAATTAELFRGKNNKGQSTSTFNIFHANIETLCPAIYNSTPAPDVRRRYSDADPAGKVVADLIERDLEFSLDSYDFDDVMKRVVRDGEVVGRGVPRVRYVPTIQQMMQEGKPVLDPITQKAMEEVTYEEVTSDYVPWKWFRRGAGTTWKDVPWIAFGDFMTRDELVKLTNGKIDQAAQKPVAQIVPVNYTSDNNEGFKKSTGDKEQSIFKRALVWQIWDKDSRKVVSICPDYTDAPLASVDDPLSLEQFFPIPRPYQPILATDSLDPVIPYELYASLVEELNKITTRINKLVEQCRPRGAFAGDAADVKRIAEAGDGELVPLNRPDLVNNGGLDAATTWFPLQPTVDALKVLVEQRNEIKQVIYEVTGIADILRGSTNPNETLGAQELKAQWGSLRVQSRQAEVQRVAKELLRLKAEIIANKFSWETITAQAGIKVPTQVEQQAAQAQLQALQSQQQQAMQPPAPPPQMNGAAPPMEGGMPGGPPTPPPGLASALPPNAAPAQPPPM